MRRHLVRMSTNICQLVLRNEDDTLRLARQIAMRLEARDVLLLNGPVGAGKTAFARALIQSLLTEPEDVPSPTFTLVQTYDTERGELWHSDLYRVNSTSELEELGLIDAFETAICIVEWPDLLGPLAPSRALSMTFRPTHQPDMRQLSMQWTDARWDMWLAECAHG